MLIFRKGITFLKKVKNLKLLGNLDAKRLPIFSFLIHDEHTGYYLHHNFVSVLLNDLFGLQTRSGCACAGLYAQKLLELPQDVVEEYYLVMKDGSFECSEKESHLIFKPGFTRFNLAYFMDENTIDYILESIKFVAFFGWMFFAVL